MDSISYCCMDLTMSTGNSTAGHFSKCIVLVESSRSRCQLEDESHEYMAQSHNAVPLSRPNGN